MSQETKAVAARLYLDIDGCVCPFGRPDSGWGPATSASVFVDYGEDRTITYDVVWAPALIDSLERLRAEFSIDLVWVTTWVEADAVRRFLVPHLGGLADARILRLPPGPRRPGETRGWWKAQRILEDQASNASPFIWVDDSEVELHGWKVLGATIGIPSLMIPPHPMVGLRPDDIRAMRSWLEALRSEP
ncbi:MULTISPECIES: HAD domain-containing protein [unclassified Cryobacterium]|uniref:HAD domain-containing protein n=1 Tax=unclassified Cryobacterium TaxID=2649013 RepID=UPI002AB4D62C|nr:MULTISPECIES: HAD domain-containing protein [unclassified Cryobacterium]MDY7528122.1 HAD domain-containing protein [Cryobacterium sp. 10C2]MDY7556129.1 HAD domain-containing protein [Cryobacterium sp. 10C3]MEB0290075.1 HAD domain-containing protein [Cryobacterium sp. 10C2]